MEDESIERLALPFVAADSAVIPSPGVIGVTVVNRSTWVVPGGSISIVREPIVTMYLIAMKTGAEVIDIWITGEGRPFISIVVIRRA